MTGRIVFFKGETDGASTTGTFPLDSDILHETVDYIRLDQGFKAKIWVMKISGVETEVELEQTEDVTAAPPTWKLLGHWYLASPGELHEDERTPIVLTSRDGKQAFRFTWSQPIAGKAYILVKAEFIHGEEG